MKIRTYVYLQLWILMCSYFKMTYTAPTSDVTNIVRYMHVKQKICGKELADIMSTVCEKHNSFQVRRRTGEHRVKRQLSYECCKVPCSYYYIIKHYCEESRIPIADEAPLSSSTATPVYDLSKWANENVVSVERELMKSSVERINRNTGNNYSRQVSKTHHQQQRQKTHKSRRWGKWRKCGCGAKRQKRYKGKDTFSVSRTKMSKRISDVDADTEADSRPPARIGVILNTRPPLIYSNANKLTPPVSKALYRYH